MAGLKGELCCTRSNCTGRKHPRLLQNFSSRTISALRISLDSGTVCISTCSLCGYLSCPDWVERAAALSRRARSPGYNPMPTEYSISFCNRFRRPEGQSCRWLNSRQSTAPLSYVSNRAVRADLGSGSSEICPSRQRLR